MRVSYFFLSSRKQTIIDERCQQIKKKKKVESREGRVIPRLEKGRAACRLMQRQALLALNLTICKKISAEFFECPNSSSTPAHSAIKQLFFFYWQMRPLYKTKLRDLHRKDSHFMRGLQKVAGNWNHVYFDGKQFKNLVLFSQHIFSTNFWRPPFSRS